VAQLGEFHLQLALVGAGTLGEDVQDQAGAVQHAALQHPLQIAFLAGGELVIEDHQIGALLGDPIADLFGLALADEQARIGGLAGAGDERHRLSARRTGQFRELAALVVPGRLGQRHVHQHRQFTLLGSFKQSLDLLASMEKPARVHPTRG
jgi:hypothetical protein